MSKEEPLKSIIEKYSENIPQDFDFIDKEQRAIKKEDTINEEEILIEDILNDYKICIVSKSVNINKKIISNQNNTNKESNEKSEQKITINIYVNNEVKTIKKLNGNSKLSEIRKMLSDIMTENAYFEKGEIKIDENDFFLKEIIEDNSIFIIDHSFEKKEKNKNEK